MKAIRILALILALALVAYGLFVERHQIHALTKDETTTIGGPAFIEGASVDGYLRRDGKLFDVYSLAPDQVELKDCKT
jgi:hypothetical protein